MLKLHKLNSTPNHFQTASCRHVESKKDLERYKKLIAIHAELLAAVEKMNLLESKIESLNWAIAKCSINFEVIEDFSFINAQLLKGLDSHEPIEI